MADMTSPLSKKQRASACIVDVDGVCTAEKKEGNIKEQFQNAVKWHMRGNYGSWRLESNNTFRNWWRLTTGGEKLSDTGTRSQSADGNKYRRISKGRWDKQGEMAGKCWVHFICYLPLM
ncbi:hypothetical protein L2E82_45166 [Cichorium intybus]|uniref:Uncharacterized protein n=1 Tax=Cichorium intybus TaxID=13427 RepID=A0ACB8ZS95_CICIN|nr:hypothetical protein L2E82_45166 [Cichorium intybus]